MPHDSGLVLVDTGMDPCGEAIDSALVAAGASWSDLSHVVLTHGHPDHPGALDHVRRSAPEALVLASPLEGLPDTGSLADGDLVGSLREGAAACQTPRAPFRLLHRPRR